MEEDKLKIFQKSVIEEEGRLFSVGTLNQTNLLASAYDLCNMFNNKILCKKIISVFNVKEKDIQNVTLFIAQYYGKAYIPNEKIEEANEIWNENVFNYFNQISPKGYCFSSQEGDSSSFGWFNDDD